MGGGDIEVATCYLQQPHTTFIQCRHKLGDVDVSKGRIILATLPCHIEAIAKQHQRIEEIRGTERC